jgi:hypothetical protein
MIAKGYNVFLHLGSSTAEKFFKMTFLMADIYGLLACNFGEAVCVAL